MGRLLAYDWPGNVRELKNVIQVALAFAGPAGRVEVDEHMTPMSRRMNEMRRPMNFEIARAEADAAFVRGYWQNLCVLCDGNQSEVARVSGSSRNTVHKYLATYGLLRNVKED